MLGVFNFLIGIAMAAGEAFINPALKGATFIKNLGVDLLGASSEFIGDATQGFIGKVADKIKEHKEQKRLKDFINENLTNIQDKNNTFHKIIQEIKIRQYDEECERKRKRTSVHKVSIAETDILKKDDIRAIMQMSTDLLFNNNITEYLNKYSDTFRNLQQQDEQSAEYFVQLIEITVNVYVKEVFYNSQNDFKVLAYVIVNALEERNQFCFTEKGCEELSDKLIQKLLPYLANQNGGVIDLQAVANAKFAPKYILRSCPGCGYDGDRLLVDEKTGTVKCAACGKSYDLVQYAEPEIYAKIVKKVEAGLEDDKEIIRIARENTGDIKEIKKQLTAYYSQSLTKDYLQACIKGQSDQFHNDLATLSKDNDKFQGDLKKRFAEVKADFSSLQKGQAQLFENSKDILSFLKNKTEEDRQVVGHFSQKLDSLDKQVNSLYDYAKEMLPELSGKSDLILEYVQKLCSKEYYEEMSNALGTDINKAISMEMKNGYEHIQALNSTSISQIISAIEDLKKDCAKGGEVIDRKIIEDSIRNANVQLSGQITGLQSLVERNQELLSAKINEGNEKTLSLLRIIIKGQEEQTAIMLANAGLKMDRNDFKRIYQGRIPSKYLFDEGFGGPFPCPYCGAEESRRLNDDQYCRCSVCGNRFLAVDPFLPQGQSDGRPIEEILKQDFGRRVDDPYIVTIGKIKKWRNNHTAVFQKMNGHKYKYKIILNDNIIEDHILILPKYDQNWQLIKEIDQTNFIADATRIKTVIFFNCFDRIGCSEGEGPFNALTQLKSIIFAGEFNPMTIKISSNAFKNFREQLGAKTKIYANQDYVDRLYSAWKIKK